MDEDKENRGKGIKKLKAEQVSEQIPESDKKTQDIKVQHDDIDPNPPRPPGLWPTFPWHFKPKWPLTRKERLAELEEISPHYEQTLQKDNIRAAKEWHASFPLDQVVPREHWCFQDGKRIKESEIDPKGGSCH